MMRNETKGQMALDVTLVPGLPQAIEDWRVARRECQLWGTRETTGLYCEATDQLARALLGDLATEARSSEVFERFQRWLIDEAETDEGEGCRRHGLAHS
jgi:hypothetical protein